MATTPGATSGSTTRTKVCILLAPSILAASSISRGTVLKNPVRSHTAYGTEKDRYTITRPILVLISSSFPITTE